MKSRCWPLARCRCISGDFGAATVRVGDDLPMSASAPEMVAVLMADLVGSTAMADRVVGQSGPS